MEFEGKEFNGNGFPLIRFESCLVWQRDISLVFKKF